MNKTLFLFTLLITKTVLAQPSGYSPETLFKTVNPDYYKEEVSSVYEGDPIVKIENPHYRNQKDNLPSLHPTSVKDLEKAYMPLNLSYDIKTPFGEKRKAGHINHTTDFYTQIHIMDDRSVFFK